MAGYLAAAGQEDRDYLLSTAGFESLEDFRKIFLDACGTIEAEEESLREVLAGAVEEMAGNPKKLALTPFQTDRKVLEEIAYYELDH